MMSCRHATEMMSQGQDRRLSFGERVSLRVHLMICVGCRNTLNHFRFLRDAISSHPWKL